MRPTRPITAVLAAAVLALVPVACGDDDEDTTVTETATAPATETGEATVEIQTGADTTETLAPAEGSEGPAFFSTPSGNIGCHVGRKAVRCDIRNRDWKPTPPAQPCELDYGHGIVLDSTHAEFVCAGDTTLGAPRTLAYGEHSQRGPFICASEPDGITCSHTENGHGFFLSRQSFRIF